MSTVTNKTPLTNLPTWFETESESQRRPAQGTVSVNDRELTLAGEDGEFTFPLSDVSDIQVGHVPDIFGPVPPGKVPVTVAFSDADGLSIALVANEKSVAQKFTLQLIKGLVNGRSVRIRHPARIGDASPDTSFERGSLALSRNVMNFGTAQCAQISTKDVTGFERTSEVIDGVEQPLIAIDFVQGDTPVRSLVQPADSQMAAVLGRYLQYTATPTEPTPTAAPRTSD